MHEDLFYSITYNKAIIKKNQGMFKEALELFDEVISKNALKYIDAYIEKSLIF